MTVMATCAEVLYVKDDVSYAFKDKNLEMSGVPCVAVERLTLFLLWVPHYYQVPKQHFWWRYTWPYSLWKQFPDFSWNFVHHKAKRLNTKIEIKDRSHVVLLSSFSLSSFTIQLYSSFTYQFTLTEYLNSFFICSSYIHGHACILKKASFKIMTKPQPCWWETFQKYEN